MEETRVMTRAQARMSEAADENDRSALLGRKEAAQPRARRALGNLTNKPARTSSQSDKAKTSDAKKGTTGVTTRRQSQVEVEAKQAAHVENDQDAANDDTRPGNRTKKAAVGFTRTLVSKSEVGATSLAKRTERLQIEGAEVLDYDVQMSPVSPMPDIDSKDLGNCLDCADYAPDIFTFFRRVEPTVRVPPDYIGQQRFVSRQMRAVLVDWLVDVHHKFKLMPESLFLAIWILDKFLSKQEVERKDLQLVGIASLVIANKYEEVYGPCLREFETVSAGTYTRSDILKMERIILRTLDFGLTVPTTFTFMRRFVKASEYGKFPEFNNLAQYLCEWSLLSNTCLQWAPSLIAASSVYASFKAFTLKQPENDWPRVMRKHTGYTLDEIQTCAGYLVNLMDKASDSQYRSLHHKFKRKEYSSVARYKAPVATFAAIAAARQAEQQAATQ